MRVDIDLFNDHLTRVPADWDELELRGEEVVVATGWAGDGAVQEQMDATVKDAIKRARAALPTGPGRSHCEECGELIPEARRQALPGARMCVVCQQERDKEAAASGSINRRGSKDSQLR